MGFIGLVADAATTIQQETDEITRFFSIAHVKQLLNDLGNCYCCLNMVYW